MLKLSSNVSDVFPKAFKLSSEVSECKPLVRGKTCLHTACEVYREAGGDATHARHLPVSCCRTVAG